MNSPALPPNSTWFDLAQGFAGIAFFACMLVAPGYLAAHLAQADFRKRSRSEQVLWSVALSLPLATALCALAGRWIPSSALTALFALLDLFAAAVLLTSRRSILTFVPSRSTRCMLCLMALFGAYCILTVTDIQLGHSLFVSTVIADWSVRVSMVRAAMRSGVPPINGLSAFNGHASPLRYYYFWYVVVAQLARSCRLSASAALAASCAWAGWAFLASVFLCLKHLAGIRDRLRRKCFLVLLLFGVLGLDVIPTAALWLSHSLHPYPEMEYWHQDRTPSFLGAVLYAPHHIAAICALLVALLLLFQERDADSSRTQARAILAGISLAAAAGTSVFPTLCFVFVMPFWSADLARRRDLRTLAWTAFAGVLSLVLAHPYLHELSAGSSAAAGFASLRWRNDAFAAYQFSRHAATAAFAGPTLRAFLLRQPAVLLLDFAELGFYTLVLVHIIRRQLFNPGRLTRAQSALWALTVGAAIPFFFLSSTATSGPNDLGVDAGFLLRLGLELFAVDWLWSLYQQHHASQVPRLYVATAVILLTLGLAAQVYQVLSERFYYVVVGNGFVHKQMDAFTLDHMPQRMYNIRSALRQFDAITPPSAPDTEAVQFNPVGAMLPAEVYFNTHQIAAWDTGCGTSYGGDYKACAPVYAGLLFLFGNTQAGVDAGRAGNDRQDGAAMRVATAADFAAACQRLHLRAIIVESTDSIWRQPTSWVWTITPLVANPTVRILPCPAT